jgi:hypothetical protein
LKTRPPGTPVPLDWIKEALGDIVAIDAELSTYQSGQAAAKALKLLYQANGVDDEEFLQTLHTS